MSFPTSNADHQPSEWVSCSSLTRHLVDSFGMKAKNFDSFNGPVEVSHGNNNKNWDAMRRKRSITSGVFGPRGQSAQKVSL